MKILLNLFVLLFSTLAFAENLSSEESLKRIKQGYLRFTDKNFRTDGLSKAEIEKQSNGQNPYAIFLSCSDSRVPPEVIFDKKIGEIFTVRSAGQSPDQNQIASIEYAIEHFDSRLIVVLGHTRCGAVQAAIDTPKEQSAGSPALDHLVKEIRNRIKKLNAQKKSFDLHDETLENAYGIKKDLLKDSLIIKKAVDSGKVKIVIALYNISSGVVEFKDDR